VEAVAAREAPNSVSRAGRKTGKVLVIPATSSMVVKASQSRWLARDSRGGISGGSRLEGPGWVRAAGPGTGQSSCSARFMAFRRFFRASACLRLRLTDGFS
jgi:hypothetical protein